MLLLENFAERRPTQAAAVDYAAKLLRRYGEIAGECSAASVAPVAYWGGALAVTIDGCTVDVWQERQPDGSLYLYGEY